MQLVMPTFSWTKSISIFLMLVIAVFAFENQQWINKDKIRSDALGYYAYLPALFIHQDFSHDSKDDYFIDGKDYSWWETGETGQKFIKYPPGMALLYSPFFALAHGFCILTNTEANGYSPPYHFMILLASLFYTFLGIWYLGKFLNRHFSDKTTAATLLIVYLGSNLFHYTANDGQLSHNYSFTLIVLFLYFSTQWIDTLRQKHFYLACVFGGLMVAVRNLDLLFLAIPVFYKVVQWKSFLDRLQLFYQNRRHLLIGMMIIFLILCPQFLYTYHVFGKPFVNTYSNEGFFFSSPKILDSLFSFRNGWLLYSPLMIFGLLGLWFSKAQKQNFGLLFFFLVGTYVYILASWWCWWFIGFGNRAYINVYPILAISIAGWIHWIFTKAPFWRWSFGTLSFLLIGLNIFQTLQFERGILHFDRMNKKFYLHAWLRTQPSETQFLLETHPHFPSALVGKNKVTVYRKSLLQTLQLNFETPQKSFSNEVHLRLQDHAKSGKWCLNVPDAYEYLGNHRFPVHPEATHVYITAWTKGNGNENLVLTADSPEDLYRLSSDISTTENGWHMKQLMKEIPSNFSLDSLTFYIWNTEREAFRLDDVRIEFLKINTALVDGE